jgi:hypothetical protein
MDDRAQAIQISFPDSTPLHMKLRVGACRLQIAPGSEGWVSGTYLDPSGLVRAKIEQEGGNVRITQEYVGGSGLGSLLRPAIPRFDLKLGRAKPYMLSLETGASDIALDLGRARPRWSADPPARPQAGRRSGQLRFFQS